MVPSSQYRTLHNVSCHFLIPRNLQRAFPSPQPARKSDEDFSGFSDAQLQTLLSYLAVKNATFARPNRVVFQRSSIVWDLAQTPRW
jgi:hypothetical protein